MNIISYFIILFFVLNSCSFDNKTGIWTGSDKISKKKLNTDKNIEYIFQKQNSVIEKVDLSPNQKLNFDKPNFFLTWGQSFQNQANNISNVSFLNDGNYKKFSKIAKANVNKNILVKDDKLFFSDYKGNIGIFSLSQNKLIYNFNFYKKKFKKTNKNIKLILQNDVIIAADNFGYVYSIDFKKNKLIWAKNFLVPFRSNLKIIENILFLSDEKNKITLIDTKNGKKIEEFYTQPSKTVSKFESNLAIDKNNNLLFLSTDGSLYSLNLINKKLINWIQNFKPENDIVFDGNPIIVSDDKILISTKNNIFLLNLNGKLIWDKKIKSNITPVISGDIIFTINDNNYLIFINKNSGEILFSNDINLMLIKDFKKNFQKKIKKINHIYLASNKLLLISDNSYFIEMEIMNNLNVSSIKKNPFNIISNIVFIKNEMIFVSDSKRIFKVN